jgi:hypothetical protein
MRVLICGDRNWTGWAAIEREIAKLPLGTTIIHGAARGADTIAATIGTRLGLEVQAYPAHWESFGRAAGPIRNRWMLDSKPDLVLAFHRNLDSGKGTKNTVGMAEKRGIEVRVFGS